VFEDTQGVVGCAVPDPVNCVLLSVEMESVPEIVGILFTVPLKAMFTCGAPVDVKLKFPLGLPVAVAIVLTCIVVLLTVEPVSARVNGVV
jgi:hypothetical protein